MQLKINDNTFFNSLCCNNNTPFYISYIAIEWLCFPVSFYISGLLQGDFCGRISSNCFALHMHNFAGVLYNKMKM